MEDLPRRVKLQMVSGSLFARFGLLHTAQST